MQVIVHQGRVFELLDVLLARWKASPKKYPFNRKDAVIPQNIIPEEIRKDTRTLACFYFYACIYMRGGIESLQVFNALIKMWRTYPDLFDPMRAQWWKQSDVQVILKRFIGWDSKAASKNWVENSKRLMRNWGGDPFTLLKGVKDYDEALLRIRNKLKKSELHEAGMHNEGFIGFQPKMVSMILYFYDWEGWLKPRFLYPSPADFHNFRFALANGAMEIVPYTRQVRTSEKISAQWREIVMAYMKARRADPVQVSDALWLFSLVMCGNSPATTAHAKHPLERKERPSLFAFGNVEEQWDHGQSVRARKSLQLRQTCLICPFAATCDYAIPAQPYYRQGILELRPRPKVIEGIGFNHLPEPKPDEIIIDQKVLQLLHTLEHPAPS